VKKYAFISEHRREYHVHVMCSVFEVSRSGYYNWLQRHPSHRERSNTELLVKIRDYFRKSKQRYGSPRIWLDLREEGIRCGKNRIARLMHQNGIVALVRKRFKVTTRKNTGITRYEPDRLQRQFVAAGLNTVWTSDITYIWTQEGWLYLVVVLDLCSRSIVGWATNARLSADFVCEAYRRAFDLRRPVGQLIVHSDRGCQYTSDALKTVLAQQRAEILVSHAYSCYDNSVTETFFHTLKTELVWWQQYETRDEAHRSLFEYIEIFYNRQRRHSSLGGQSPCNFERLFLKP
jgi:putative transposase